jgi:hypothetical protein
MAMFNYKIRLWDPICHTTSQSYGLGHYILLKMAH